MDKIELDAETERYTEKIGEEFLASIYRAATVRHPEDIGVLSELGHVYTRLGRYQDGLEVDHKLVAFAPEDPTIRYNLACSLALLGRKDEALETLEIAIQLGYSDFEFMVADEDLSDLRDDPRFQSLVASARES